MKAIHNLQRRLKKNRKLCYISKILKNESNSQPRHRKVFNQSRCVISQRYSKMKAIHNGVQ